jgi:hypothetical protein
MQHKKKPKKKKAAPPIFLSADEEALVTEILQTCGNSDPTQLVAGVTDSRIAQILIERLPLDETTPISLLVALRERFEHKEVQKAIKRSLFRLKNKGILTESLPNEKNRSPTILKPTQKEAAEAHLGPLDLNGSRAALVMFHRSLKGQDVALGIVSDEEGIQQFHHGVSGKKRARELKALFAQDAGPLVSTSLSHVTTVFEEAYRRHLELHPEAPQDYLDIRPWLLENSALLEQPAIYDIMPDGDTSDKGLTNFQLEKLFEHELMQSWIIDFERLRQCMEDILSVDDSPIVLTEPQRLDRIRHIKEKSIEEVFPLEKRARLQHRFEEMAHVFYKLDQEDYCHLCLAAAHSIVQKETILKMNPVIEFILERSLDFYMDRLEKTEDEEQPEDKDTQRIIIP